VEINNNFYLEANINKMSDAPQVAYTQGALEAYPVHHQQEDKIHKQDVQPYFADTTQSTPQVPPETILGLRRRNFWILFAVIVLVVCATIGGSVGGSLAVQKSKYVGTIKIK
jgi:hypothetical protein